MTPVNELGNVLESLPESMIVCDQEGKIQAMNAAACALFEVTHESQWRGRCVQECLLAYAGNDKQQSASTQEQELLTLVLDEAASSPAQLVVLHMPSGRTTYVTCAGSPVLDHHHVVGTLWLYHNITSRYHKALRLQCVQEALLTLMETIMQVPFPLVGMASSENLLLSPLVREVAQPLVDLIVRVLACQSARLFAVEPTSRQFQELAGSIVTSEQEQHPREIQGHALSSAQFPESLVARLRANEEVLLVAGNCQPILALMPAPCGAEQVLMLPLFLEYQFAGMLVLIKERKGRSTTEEEVALEKAVALQTTLLLNCLCRVPERRGTSAQTHLLHEVSQLLEAFLTLASQVPDEP